jgi:hypothetical protein
MDLLECEHGHVGAGHRVVVEVDGDGDRVGQVRLAGRAIKESVVVLQAPLCRLPTRVDHRRFRHHGGAVGTDAEQEGPGPRRIQRLQCVLVDRNTAVPAPDREFALAPIMQNRADEVIRSRAEAGDESLGQACDPREHGPYFGAPWGTVGGQPPRARPGHRTVVIQQS